MLKNLIEVRKPPTAGSAIGVQGICECDDADFEQTSARGGGLGQDEDQNSTIPESTVSGSEREQQLDGNPTSANSRSLQLIVITHDRRLVFSILFFSRVGTRFNLDPTMGFVSKCQEFVIIYYFKVEHLYMACRPEYIYGLSKDEYGVSRIKVYNRISTNELN